MVWVVDPVERLIYAATQHRNGDNVPKVNLSPLDIQPRIGQGFFLFGRGSPPALLALSQPPGSESPCSAIAVCTAPLVTSQPPFGDSGDV